MGGIIGFLCICAVLISQIYAAEVGVVSLLGPMNAPQVQGTMYFVTLNESTVWVWAQLEDSEGPRLRGMQIFTYGDLYTVRWFRAEEGPYSLQDHYIGAGVPVHGCPENTSMRHEGDLGNWALVDNAMSTQSKFVDLVSLSGNTSIIGRLVLQRSFEDDCVNMTDIEGGTAGGVVGIANMAKLPAEVAAMVPNISTANTAAGVVGENEIATAYLLPTANGTQGLIGVVYFDQEDNGVSVRVAVDGLDPNAAYGIHIHEFGAISDDGMASGSHYNPNGAPHGLPDSTARHVGDLGNICSYDKDGIAYYSHTFTNLLSLNQIIGRMVVIHSKYDSGRSSDFGSRIAQGVIGLGFDPIAEIFFSRLWNGSEAVTIKSPGCETFDVPLQVAVAHLVPATGANVTGSVYFVTVNSSQVWVWANISQISVNPDANHGLHVHTFGDITDAKGANTGGHYFGVYGVDVHACESTVPRHEGDMGNWPASRGAINASKVLDLLALSGQYSIIGRGVILHANPDDCQNTNSSGARLAQGVIGIANPSTFPAPVSQFIASVTMNPINSATVSDMVTTNAFAVIKPVAGSAISGIVTFEQKNESVTVRAMIQGLPSNTHAYAFHIHTFGDFASPSTHYNPWNASHNLPPGSERHVGDMGNICTFSGSAAYYEYTFTNLITLYGNTSIMGRSVIVHSAPDTNGTSYGTIIGQGIIGYPSPNATTVQIPPSLTINDPACLDYRPTSPPTATTTTTGQPTSSPTSTPTKYPTNKPTPTPTPVTKKTGMSGAAKAGIVLLVFGVVIAIVAVGLYFNKYKRFPWEKRRHSSNDYVAFEDPDLPL